MVKHRRQHGQSAVRLGVRGKNPTDRGKMGIKRSVLTDENGLPLAVVLSGANTHDVKLLEDTLDRLVVERPKTCEGKPQNFCMNAGYIGHQDEVEHRNYIAHIRPRGEEKEMLEHDPGSRARRWVVEVVHSSFMNRFRKLLVRYDKEGGQLPGLGSARLCYFV